MIILEHKVYVVLKLTRGSSIVIGVFNEELHAQKFMIKIAKETPGKYNYQESTLFDFTE